MNRNQPTLVPFNSTIAQISAGFYFSLFLDTTGSVYAFGSNAFGQCGDDNTMFPSFILPKLMLNTGNIIKVSAGGQHTVLLGKNGTVMTVGYNNVFLNFK